MISRKGRLACGIGTAVVLAASAASLPVVVGAPAPPTAVKAVSASTTTTTASLRVTFALGANNGSAITSQTATCTSSNGGLTRTGTHTGATPGPITVAAVTTAKTYTCTVKASNARGASLASAPSLPVVVGAPAPPTAVRAVSASTTTTTASLRVTFALGADNGSAITSQTATCISSNGGITGFAFLGGTTAGPITLVGLTTAKTYTCTVQAGNERGASLASAPSLPVVVGAPAPPTAVKAVSASTTTTTGSLRVTFALGADNGSAITSQTATCASRNGGLTRTGTHTGPTPATITVAAVTTAKTYTCTVTASNVRGASLASAPSLPAVVGSPGAPTGVTASRLAAGQIKVTFIPGANNGSPTTGYTTRCISNDGGVPNVKSGTASPLTVVGLSAGKSYTCRVTAINARGTSLASIASGATTA